jgi:hypothetical protein
MDPTWTDAQHTQVRTLVDALRETVRHEIATGTLTIGMLNAALIRFLGDTLGRSAVNAHESRTMLHDDANEIARQATALALETYEFLQHHHHHDPHAHD